MKGLIRKKLYGQLIEYQRSTDACISRLEKTDSRNLTLEYKEIKGLKKDYLFTHFLLGSFSATGAFF